MQINRTPPDTSSPVHIALQVERDVRKGRPVDKERKVAALITFAESKEINSHELQRRVHTIAKKGKVRLELDEAERHAISHKAKQNGHHFFEQLI